MSTDSRSPADAQLRAWYSQFPRFDQLLPELISPLQSTPPLDYPTALDQNDLILLGGAMRYRLQLILTNEPMRFNRGRSLAVTTMQLLMGYRHSLAAQTTRPCLVDGIEQLERLLQTETLWVLEAEPWHWGSTASPADLDRLNSICLLYSVMEEPARSGLRAGPVAVGDALPTMSDESRGVLSRWRLWPFLRNQSGRTSEGLILDDLVVAMSTTANARRLFLQDMQDQVDLFQAHLLSGRPDAMANPLKGIEPHGLNGLVRPDVLLRDNDGCWLIDFWTRKSWKPADLVEKLQQLSMSALLDDQNRLGITGVGFYFSRHGCWVRLDLADVLAQASGRDGVIDLGRVRRGTAMLLRNQAGYGPYLRPIDPTPMIGGVSDSDILAVLQQHWAYLPEVLRQSGMPEADWYHTIWPQLVPTSYIDGVLHLACPADLWESVDSTTSKTLLSKLGEGLLLLTGQEIEVQGPPSMVTVVPTAAEPSPTEDEDGGGMHHHSLKVAVSHRVHNWLVESVGGQEGVASKGLLASAALAAFARQHHYRPLTGPTLLREIDNPRSPQILDTSSMWRAWLFNRCYQALTRGGRLTNDDALACLTELAPQWLQAPGLAGTRQAQEWASWWISECSRLLHS